MIVELDMVSIGLAIFFLPSCVSIAVMQYRGTFCRSPFAATATSVLLYIVGGLVAFGFVMSTGEAIVGGFPLRSLRLMTPILVPVFLVAACALTFGRMNALWSRKLRSAIASNPTSKIKRGVSFREIFLGVGALAAMTGIACQFTQPSAPSFAEHVDASAAPFGLPANATDVSYGKRYRGTIAFEFTTDEAAFREWVGAGIGSIESQSANIRLLEITSPQTIARYNLYAVEPNGPNRISVDNGLFYSWSKKDRAVYTLFDRDSNRAYYQAHFH